jgi:hypothetical protein
MCQLPVALACGAEADISSAVGRRVQFVMVQEKPIC